MREPFFLLLLELSQAHANRSREGFQRLNLSDGQPKILYILGAQDGQTQKELADLCRIRPSTLTVMLDKMEKKSYLYREQVVVSGGKRAYRIHLTETGREMAEKVRNMMDELDARSLQGLSEEETELFYDLMKRVIDNLEE